MAWLTIKLRPEVTPLPAFMVDRHFKESTGRAPTTARLTDRGRQVAVAAAQRAAPDPDGSTASMASASLSWPSRKSRTV